MNIDISVRRYSSLIHRHWQLVSSVSDLSREQRETFAQIFNYFLYKSFLESVYFFFVGHSVVNSKCVTTGSKSLDSGFINQLREC